MVIVKVVVTVFVVIVAEVVLVFVVTVAVVVAVFVVVVAVERERKVIKCSPSSLKLYCRDFFPRPLFITMTQTYST